MPAKKGTGLLGLELCVSAKPADSVNVSRRRRRQTAVEKTQTAA
ncbi:MAG: hypothetical protein U0M19_10290 [Caecibacter sp.]|nr:hypothetical protein [Caecibacter sp.]